MSTLLTQNQLDNLDWEGKEKYALVNPYTLQMPYTATLGEKQWLIDTKRELDLQWEHPHARKLVLVEKPD